MIALNIFRHGTTQPEYDRNGRQINSKEWDLVEHFDCSEHVMEWPSDRNTDIFIGEGSSEQEVIHKLFYIEIKCQDNQINLNIKHGDYIQEVNCNGYIWKLLAYSQQEVFDGCWVVMLRGQRLSNREIFRLGIQDLETFHEILTGR